MTFYQELQLNQAGSKAYISGFEKRKDKLIHIAVYLFKIILNIAFSMAVIILSGIIFGFENCIAGLVLLLAIMTFRFSDLGIHASHSVAGIFIIFAIFAAGPKLANIVPVGWAFCINFSSIFLIVFTGCHNVKMCNHATLVLSYILLFGSDVSGTSYLKRLLCLLLGAVLASIVLYHNHRKQKYDGGFFSIFRQFSLSSERSRWQIRHALCISGAMLVASLLGVSKVSWVGIAAMSVTFPDRNVISYRFQYRILGNVFGSFLFVALYLLLPENLISAFGLIGGIGLGLSAVYGWQTVFNSLSAISAAATGTLGVQSAVLFRIINNMFGACFALVFDRICEPVLKAIDKLLLTVKRKTKKTDGIVQESTEQPAEEIENSVEEIQTNAEGIQNNNEEQCVQENI